MIQYNHNGLRNLKVKKDKENLFTVLKEFVCNLYNLTRSGKNE